MDKNELPKGVTADQIEQWKEKYGADNICLAILENSREESLTVVVRVPDRQIFNMSRKYADSDIGKAEDILVKACLLSHTSEVIEGKDDCLYYSCVHAINQLLPLRRAVVKKL